MPKYFFKKDKKVVDIEKYFGIIVTAVAKSNKNISENRDFLDSEEK